jgi:hypothetical protein
MAGSKAIAYALQRMAYKAGGTHGRLVDPRLHEEDMQLPHQAFETRGIRGTGTHQGKCPYVFRLPENAYDQLDQVLLAASRALQRLPWRNNIE